MAAVPRYENRYLALLNHNFRDWPGVTINGDGAAPTPLPCFCPSPPLSASARQSRPCHKRLVSWHGGSAMSSLWTGTVALQVHSAAVTSTPTSSASTGVSTAAAPASTPMPTCSWRACTPCRKTPATMCAFPPALLGPPHALCCGLAHATAPAQRQHHTPPHPWSAAGLCFTGDVLHVACQPAPGVRDRVAAARDCTLTRAACSAGLPCGHQPARHGHGDDADGQLPEPHGAAQHGAPAVPALRGHVQGRAGVGSPGMLRPRAAAGADADSRHTARAAQPLHRAPYPGPRPHPPVRPPPLAPFPLGCDLSVPF